jgi:hypothetical protein
MFWADNEDNELGAEFIVVPYVSPMDVIEEQLKLTAEQKQVASKGMMEALKGLKTKRQYLLHSLNGSATAATAAAAEYDEYGVQVIDSSPQGGGFAMKMPLRFVKMGANPWHAKDPRFATTSPGKNYVNDLRRMDNNAYTPEAWA